VRLYRLIILLQITDYFQSWTIAYNKAFKNLAPYQPRDVTIDGNSNYIVYECPARLDIW